ncbi:flagellar biosynthetic protein FliR [Buchnera aphidicola (Aphis craccivora)]|uniref:Flagellar biosynthetic protein FliR n=1 Tax=Buchnera aphidicola (Aphis craccivora) TaxID=466616 RepID=A0A4D6XN00_9GAMM|nr:flagellar biosynthetic protein FliR [Buchnera aphidicola]QCI16348.1 flagellar biosynthetic protein FliR [Buchnera aphidicola (Aphis craccivora)]QLL40491.1 flagellar biosynthetic protein FliR [Buchnera aphidicola (Aphis craccivore)]WAI17861.1 MAG: flagellar biosynthetic protein FliR [Buchnera aphidicola (Aphis craccivora)]
MLIFNNLQLLTIISSFFWPLVRILAFFSTAPIFNDQHINKKTKIVLSILITWIVFPFLPKINIEMFSFSGLLLLLQQIFIGITLGFTCQFLFATINFSGELIGLQMGLSFATFFNANSNIGVSIISRLLNVLMLSLFLSVNAHLYLISILINTFYSIPINVVFLNSNVFLNLLKFSSNIFLNSIMFVLPIIIFLLLSNLIMSILNRLSPQMSIFSIGFPLNLLIGIIVLYYLISISFPIFNNLLSQLILFLSDIFLKV